MERRTEPLHLQAPSPKFALRSTALPLTGGQRDKGGPNPIITRGSLGYGPRRRLEVTGARRIARKLRGGKPICKVSTQSQRRAARGK